MEALCLLEADEESWKNSQVNIAHFAQLTQEKTKLLPQLARTPGGVNDFTFSEIN